MVHLLGSTIKLTLTEALPPVCTIPLALWISNAVARFSGIRGAVSIQARRVDCSRQAIYDQARKVHGAVQAEYSGGPTREVLIRENQALRCDTYRLGSGWDGPSEFTLAKQQKFSAIASGMGLSLTQIQVLLTLILGPWEAPSRTTTAWVQAAGEAAGQGPQSSGRPECKEFVLVGCLDEIFDMAVPCWWALNRRAWSGSWGGRRSPNSGVQPGLAGRLGTPCNT